MSEQPVGSAAAIPEVVLPTAWVGADEAPTIFANQFVVQYQDGEVFLLVGTITPPLVNFQGSQEELRQELTEKGPVPIRLHAKVGLTPRRARELMTVLASVITAHEQAEREGRP